MKVGSIYIIKNTVNNNVYIGQTTMTVRERFMVHLKPSVEKRNVNRHLYNAIKKHGKDNFYVETLEDNINIDEIDQKEIYYIKYYNSYEGGYNSTCGGDGRIINKLNHEDDVLSLEKEGKTSSELAIIFGVHKATILRTLHKLGFYYNGNVTKEILQKLINEGYSNSDMAIKLSVDKMTISRLRGKYNLKAYNKKVNLRDDFDLNLFKFDYENGMKRVDLCLKHNVTNTTMNRIATTNNFKNYLSIDKRKEKENVDAELFKLKNEGVSVRELIIFFGIKEKTIYSRISDYKKCRD